MGWEQIGRVAAEFTGTFARTEGDDIARMIGSDFVRGVDDLAPPARGSIAEILHDIHFGTPSSSAPIDDVARSRSLLEELAPATRSGLQDAPEASYVLPMRYDEAADAALAYDDALRAPGVADHLADDVETLVWNDYLELTPEGAARYRYAGGSGVLEDPDRFIANLETANLDAYPLVEQRVRPWSTGSRTSFEPFDETFGSSFPGSTFDEPWRYEPPAPTYEDPFVDPFTTFGGDLF
ncbi:MAG: hypothetical protein KDC46_00455 [Thermoleophilia bacterium]|nr:hypothetical protein [Thermoleophilia bacterium]